MPLVPCVIIFNNSPSKFNKDLIDFLQRNLPKANVKGNMHFTFQIAKPNDLVALRNKGVKKLPVMFIASSTIVGVSDIIDEIRNRIKNTKNEAKIKSDDELIHDHQMNSMFDGAIRSTDGKMTFKDDNDAPDDDFARDLAANGQKEMNRRGITKQDTNDHNQRVHQPMRRDNVTQDYDEPIRRNSHNNQRNNNLTDNNDMSDVFQSIQNTKVAGKEAAQDDAMMAALFANQGM